MERVLRFASWPHPHESPRLGDILQAAVEERPCRVGYGRDGELRELSVQFFRVASDFGQWYATAWDLATDAPRVLRCDRVHTVEPIEGARGRPLASFALPARELYRAEGATDFELVVTAQGADLFHKEHYPSMELVERGGRPVVRGFYNPGEEAFIADYLIRYGTELQEVEPASLRALVARRLGELRAHFDVLLDSSEVASS